MRYIYSLLKKYLRMTSLLNPSSLTTSNTHIPSLSTDFNYFSSLFHLLSDLFTIYGWVGDEKTDAHSSLKGLSIFTGTSPPGRAADVSKNSKPYKSRRDFMTDSEYGQYMKSMLQPGMRVRARVSYESVTEGDVGTYRRTNEGIPPAHVDWDGLGEPYWVYWHYIEIIDSSVSLENGKFVKVIQILIEYFQ